MRLVQRHGGDGLSVSLLVEIVELILMILEVWVWSGVNDRLANGGAFSESDPQDSTWKLFVLALFLGLVIGTGSFVLTKGLVFSSPVAQWSSLIAAPLLTALAACVWRSRKSLPDKLDWTSFWVVFTFSAVVGLSRFGLHAFSVHHADGSRRGFSSLGYSIKLGRTEDRFG